MPYRTSIATEFRARMQTSRVGLLQVFTAAILVSTLSIVWNYARIRSQPPERIVRVEVRMPGPVRVVQVPALPAPQCVEHASPMYLHALHGELVTCPNGGIVHVVPGDHDNHVVVECHCPRPQ